MAPVLALAASTPGARLPLLLLRGLVLLQLLPFLLVLGPGEQQVMAGDAKTEGMGRAQQLTG